MSIISTNTIVKAIDHYKSKGYKIIDVPLIVDEQVSGLTKPRNKKDLYHNNKVYVGSAEQSFLQLYKQGNLVGGKYMALTPCYRDEPELDVTHYLMFLKLELIALGDNYNTMEVINDALEFFNEYGITSLIPTQEAINSFDIEINGVEIGSYGKRTMFDGTTYVYGTGIAEPRFTYVCTLRI